jgi:predicted transposase YbfD/YdcC
MESSPSASLIERFSILVDPRDDRAKRHRLIDIIVIAVCAVIGGADSWVDVEWFGKSKRDWFDRLLELPNGIPSHDTFGRVFAMVDSRQFEKCFVDWVSAVNEVTRGQVVAIDGKTLRRSHDRFIGKSAIHMVSGWATANHLVLGQTSVDDRSNEITAIPQLLKTLDVSGCIVTIDAMGCQTEIASTVIDQGADYVLALKKNQPQLHQDVTRMFAEARKSDFAGVDHDYCETVNKGHGRIETRRCWTVSDSEYIGYFNDCRQWPGLTSVAMIESKREVDGRRSTEVRYYISSLSKRADRMLSAVRGHWAIENSLHWMLDVAFNEDDCRVRVGNAAENFSILRRMALNILKRESSSKVGVRAKRKRAGWDPDYLITVLNS